MARKRLSDLLREEAQKPVEGEPSEAEPSAASAPEQPAPPARSPRGQAKSSRAASSKPAASRAKAAPESQAAEKSAEAPAAPEPPSPTPLPETEMLTQQLSELQTALEAAQRREDLLKHQVLDLETALEAEKERSQQLQQELDAAKLQNRPLVSLPDHPAVAPAPATTLRQQSSQPVSILEAELEKIFRQPVSTEPPYKELSSEDIGWMD